MAAPRGNQNAKQGSEWREAIKGACRQNDTKNDWETGRTLRACAAKLIEKGLEGDMAALKEIGDRYDGRPKQQTEISGPDGKSLTVVVSQEDVDA